VTARALTPVLERFKRERERMNEKERERVRARRKNSWHAPSCETTN